jgi:hypothetical protein
LNSKTEIRKNLNDEEKRELLKDVGKMREDTIKSQREAIRRILSTFADRVVKGGCTAPVINDEATATAIILTNVMNSYATTAVISSFNVLKTNMIEMLDENGKRIVESFKLGAMIQK